MYIALGVEEVNRGTWAAHVLLMLNAVLEACLGLFSRES